VNARSRSESAHPTLARQLAIFAAVGGAAFITHFSVVTIIVPFGIQPLLANVVAFCVAFGVSFAGHNRWTFPARGERDRSRALRRFATVACASFVMNEMVYAVLLNFTRLPYQIALLMVLSVVASFTLLSSKFWAFSDDSA
jgi:putative flippase GtrA